jgi:hypothetical protein
MLTLEQVLLAAAQYYNPEPRDQQEFITPGFHQFTVPTGVTSISAVAIGGGGGGASNVNDGGGGGGGSLQYRNDISVTPGETLTVVVGEGGEPAVNAGSGGYSSVSRYGGAQLVRANGGGGARSQFGGPGGSASSNSATSIPYSPLGNSSLGSVNGVLSVVTDTNVDDTSYQINLPFTIYFLGVAYNRIFVGSNAYITFSAGSSIYYGYSPSQPPGPHVLIYPADRRLFQLYTGRRDVGTTNEKFVIRQHGGDYATPSRTNIWEAHFYPNADYFDIFFITDPGGNYVTPGISNGSTYLTNYASTAGTAVRISTVDPSVTGVAGYSGGVGGSGSQAFGGNWLAGGGGGAAGYAGNGGAAGDGNNSSGQAGNGGGGGGGNADDSLARGGGGTGLQGIGNNGSGNGGGGSSYNATTSSGSAASNTGGDLYPVDLHYAWGNFINTYGVWISPREYTDNENHRVDRGFYAPRTGRYTFEYAADNAMAFYVDGTLVGDTNDFVRSYQTTQELTAGAHVLTMYVRNFGGGAWYNNPAGFAITIRDIAGTLIWDTRTYRLMNSTNSLVRIQAGGTSASGQNGGTYGGGGGGRDTDGGAGEGGRGGNGGVRIIWGRGRSYPYQAQDVIPVTIASTSGLILHYDAANVSSYNGGSVIYDLSGNANHGTISLGFTPATVPTIGTNRVIRFPSNQNTKIDFYANELTSASITVEMWALVSDFAGGMFFGWYIHDVWTSGGTLGYNTGQGDVYGISAARINELNLRNRWAHYVFVMNAGDYTLNRIYINGASQGLSQQYSNQYTPYANFNGGQGRIGGWRLENSYQQVMDLGIFKIYNRRLTQAEITTNYNENLARFSTPIYNAGLIGRFYSGYYFNDDVNFSSSRTALTTQVVQETISSSYQDLYTWEYVGYFRPPATGTYTFVTYSDDASYIWVGSTATSGYSTGNALVNNGGLHGIRGASGSINLVAGTYYPIRIQFGENYGADQLTVGIGGPTGYLGGGSGYFFYDDQTR